MVNCFEISASMYIKCKDNNGLTLICKTPALGIVRQYISQIRLSKDFLSENYNFYTRKNRSILLRYFNVTC